MLSSNKLRLVLATWALCLVTPTFSLSQVTKTTTLIDSTASGSDSPVRIESKSTSLEHGARFSFCASPAGRKDKGNKVRITQFSPAQPGKYPALVIVHGLHSGNAFDEILDMQGKKYAGDGYVVFVVHYFDRTGTTSRDVDAICAGFKAFIAGKKQDPDEKISSLYYAWRQTVRDALAHARRQPQVDGERIALAGFSLGAYLCLDVAADPSVGIKAVVEFFGGLPRPLHARLKSLPPVLAIHGDKDDVVPVSEAHTLRDILKSKNLPCDLQIYPGVGHVFVDAKGAFQPFPALQADLHAAAFLAQHLKSTANSSSREKRSQPR